MVTEGASSMRTLKGRAERCPNPGSPSKESPKPWPCLHRKGLYLIFSELDAFYSSSLIEVWPLLVAMAAAKHSSPCGLSPFVANGRPSSLNPMGAWGVRLSCRGGRRRGDTRRKSCRSPRGGALAAALVESAPGLLRAVAAARQQRARPVRACVSSAGLGTLRAISS